MLCAATTGNADRRSQSSIYNCSTSVLRKLFEGKAQLFDGRHGLSRAEKTVRADGLAAEERFFHAVPMICPKRTVPRRLKPV
jgi:hypothetical protein